jgi:hypothetical protein
MPLLELVLLGLLAIGLSLAGWSLFGARGGQTIWRRALVLSTLLLLGGSTLVAAVHQAEMLIYLGLAAGGFLSALLWEGAHAAGSLE